MIRILHNGTEVKQRLTVPAGAKIVTSLQYFDAADDSAADAEITRRGLLLLDTPGRKQLHLFTTAYAQDPAMLAPFVKLKEPLTALNDAAAAVNPRTGKPPASPDYSAAKAMLESVVIDTNNPGQVALKAALLACYP